MGISITENEIKKMRCPRCNARRIEPIRTSPDDMQITCKKCGLSKNVPAKFISDTLDFFRTSKTGRVEYAIRAIKEYGNAYVGDFTLSVWGKNRGSAIDRLKGYLEERLKLKKPLTVRETNMEYDDGIVFQMSS